ncbi:Major facilitator superfamily [Mycobacteroides abscessus subsp. abscessus]|nr:Major facilitator superfamily [Mycobacteroides abscessus subsp. abscessus]SKE22811.1 Major facilitator superfamily [Mycobacteroides abscessus subsp. abscessus]
MMGVVGASIGNFLVAFDASAINVALPTATEELHATVDVGQWFLDGYTIPLCVFLLVSGAIGDRYGAVKVYRWSMLAFLAASVACAAADTAGTLIVARIAQGVGASRGASRKCEREVVAGASRMVSAWGACVTSPWPIG